jgi:FlaA1/EpsC-like NDP-sugar epimerase
MKEVKTETLIGRSPIKVNNDEILNHLTNKVILVTGGGGSIGSELCRQIAAHAPKLLIIFDVYENNAYDIEQDLNHRYLNLNLLIIIGSVRDSAKINSVFEKYHPEIVFHAAAHKHVPLMESSPCEAIKNNVLGTYKTAYAAVMNGCKRFLLISTDKAVNPTNIMGASKRLCEMVVQMMDKMVRNDEINRLPLIGAHAIDNDLQSKIVKLDNRPYHENHTEFVAVRFGNVLGSNGSVIPLFCKQIEAGGPVTVTHPDIIRYFMTIPEAVSLVLQASTYAKGGEIFILDMGKPVKIDTLARKLIKMYGLQPDVDIKIQYTGLRPGEKLYEETLMAEEGLMTTPNKLIHIGKPINFDIELFLKQLTQLAEISYQNDDEAIIKLVSKIVATYRYSPHGLDNKTEAYKAQICQIKG